MAVESRSPQEWFSEQAPDGGKLTGVERLVPPAVGHCAAFVIVMGVGRLAVGPERGFGQQIIRHAADGIQGLGLHIRHSGQHFLDRWVVVFLMRLDGHAEWKMALESVIKDAAAEASSMNERVLRGGEMTAQPQRMSQAGRRLKVPVVTAQIGDQFQRLVSRIRELLGQKFRLRHGHPISSPVAVLVGLVLRRSTNHGWYGQTCLPVA